MKSRKRIAKPEIRREKDVTTVNEGTNESYDIREIRGEIETRKR
jgi:hypothetical protein